MEAEADEKLQPLFRRPIPGLEFTILAQLGLVDFHATATAETAGKAERLLGRAERIVRRLVGRHIFGMGDDTLESVVGGLLRKKKWMLATAESCTAGLLSARLTRVPGSSKYYLGGVVAYSNEIKLKALGVSKTTLKKYGAVSGEAAEEMAQGVLEKTGADVAVSITGIAGPDGGSAKKPVGLVFIGLARPGKTMRAVSFKFLGTRGQIRERGVAAALTLLYRMLY